MSSNKWEMSDEEYDMLRRYLNDASVYFEWGAGKSTEIAQQHDGLDIYTVESDHKIAYGSFGGWLLSPLTKSKMVVIDIGPTAAGGRPIDMAEAYKFPAYPLELAKSADVDLILIDGRFRIACAMVSALKYPGVIVLFHDICKDRPNYNVIFEIYKEIEHTNMLYALKVRDDFHCLAKRQRAFELFKSHLFDWR